MDPASEARLFGALDVLSLQVAKLGDQLGEETGNSRKEMRAGFERVDRRLGHLETRVESLEGFMRSNTAFLGERLEDHERRIAALEQ